MEIEEAIKVLKHWSTTISACDIDSNNRIAQALERVLNYIKEESIPIAVVKELIQQKKSRIEKLHPASDCVIIDDLENQIQVLQEILNKGENK